MSQAFAKNEAALAESLGQNGLGSRLQSARIGVWTATDSAVASGNLLARALGDLHGRFWQQVDVFGPLAPPFIEAARSAAASGAQRIDARQGWNPPYDAVVVIGRGFPEAAGPTVQIGAAGWDVTTGRAAQLSDDRNPVGPFAAAAIAASETFKTVFADALGDRGIRIPVEYRWSVWDFGQNGECPSVQPIHLPDVHVFGVGAVTHAMLWPLLRWPAEVSGRLHLVDHDAYGESNGQRYPGMQAGDLGGSKVAVMASRLRAQHPGLEVVEHATNLNHFFGAECSDFRVALAVVGVDSKEDRRQLALKLPRRVVNMWTDGPHVGAARHGFEDGWPCLCCVYPEDVTAPFDETGQIVNEMGLPPVRVRELLMSGAGLGDQDLSAIRQRYGIAFRDDLIGKPLRSVRQAICATANIGLPTTGETISVPLPFASALAGTGGLVELLRELWSVRAEPSRWQLRVFHYPTAGNLYPTGRSTSCYLCSDPLVLPLIREKYV